MWVGVLVMMIPSIVFAIALPRLKVGFMTTAWRLPYHTFMCSRPLLRLIGSSLVGNLAGTIALAFLVADIHLPILVLVAPTAIAFVYSACQRFQKHPNSEFAMPLPLPYPFGRRMRLAKNRLPVGG